MFNASGNFKELEQEIKTDALPKSAVDYCTKTFPGYKLSEAAKITDANNKVSFEAEMEKGKEHFDVIFDVRIAPIRLLVVGKRCELFALVHDRIGGIPRATATAGEGGA